MDLIDFGIWLTFFLIIIGAASAVFFSIINMYLNPKGAKATIFSLIGVGLVVLISFLLADNDVLGNIEVADQTAKKVGAGLITLYIFMFGAIATIVIAEISKLIKQ